MPDHGGPITRTTASASEETATEYSTYEVADGLSGGAYDAEGW